MRANDMGESGKGSPIFLYCDIYCQNLNTKEKVIYGEYF